MKKFSFLLLTFLAIILFSCEKQRNQSDIQALPFEHEIKKESQIKSKKRNCATMKVLQEKLRKDPKLKEKMDKIHKHSIAYSNAKSNKKPKNNGGDNEEEVSIIEGKIILPLTV